MPRTAHQADKLTGDVSLNDYVTGGRGTTGTPWVLSASVGSVAAGTCLRARPGYYYSATEIRFTNDRVKLVGAGAGTTFIRGGDTGTGKAVVRFAKTTSAEMTHVEIAGITFDGNGVVDYGLVLRNVNYSTFDVDFRNAKSWCMRTSRGICNRGRIRALGYLMDVLVTPNGLYLGDGPGPYTGESPGTVGSYSADYFTTCSHWDAIEVNSLPGIGLEVNQSFSNVFTGGAVEGCGVNLILTSSTRNCVFNGTDFEYATGTISGVAQPAGVQIDGDGHVFANNDVTDSSVLLTGTGNHRFTNLHRASSVTDNCTSPTHYVADADNFAVVGTNSQVTVEYGSKWKRRGDAVREIWSSDGTGVAGTSYTVSGSRVGYTLQVSSGGVYVVSGGGIADYATATLEQAAGLKVNGRDVQVLGGSLQVTNAAAGGGVSYLEVLSPGARQFVTAVFGNGTYFVSGGGINPRDGSAVGANYAMVLDGANVRIRGNLGVGNAAAATTPGSVVKKIEVFDASGTSLGFVPVYSSIT